MEPNDHLSAAEIRLKRAVSGLVSAHKRKNKNGKVSNIDSYYRISSGKKLKVGDIIVDSYGNKKTVLTTDHGRIVFSDFTSMPEGWNFRVAGNALDSTEKTTGTVIDPTSGPATPLA